jgi:beta-phosphoglucomutase
VKTKACIFDLDGVLVDTAKYHFLAWKRLADKLKIKFTEKDNERLKGVSRMKSLDIILEIGKLNLTNDIRNKYAALKNEWYRDYISHMTPDEILPGSIEFLKELRKAGILTGIGSASKNTPLILEKTGLKKYFDVVADGNIITKAKPDPEIFVTVSEMLETEPSKCIVFEDAVAGVQAAHNAGMICIGIGSSDILNEAQYVVKGLYQLNLKKLEDIEKLSGDEKAVSG